MNPMENGCEWMCWIQLTHCIQCRTLVYMTRIFRVSLRAYNFLSRLVSILGAHQTVRNDVMRARHVCPSDLVSAPISMDRFFSD
jgi:hypothetical protein